MQESDGTYGAPRIAAELRDEGGLVVNHKRVARIMKAIGLEGLRLRRRHRTTVADPAAVKAPDLVSSDFTASEVNAKYVGDITYMPGSSAASRSSSTCAQAAWPGGRSPITCVPNWSPMSWRRPGRLGEARSSGDPRRSRLSIHESGIRRSMQVSRESPEHERDRIQRGQRRRRVVQRDLQKRNTQRQERLVGRARGRRAEFGDSRASCGWRRCCARRDCGSRRRCPRWDWPLRAVGGTAGRKRLLREEAVIVTRWPSRMRRPP
ncbi:IS3 family transposase [Streptomyces sp. NPDC006283]|uniref:IS3 family transposase n=1 Tax=Streptomyces sp. NPDC006283 TaxID=3156741 RepID=UPI0033BF9CBD